MRIIIKHFSLKRHFIFKAYILQWKALEINKIRNTYPVTLKNYFYNRFNYTIANSSFYSEIISVSKCLRLQISNFKPCKFKKGKQ